MAADADRQARGREALRQIRLEILRGKLLRAKDRQRQWDAERRLWLPSVWEAQRERLAATRAELESALAELERQSGESDVA